MFFTKVINLFKKTKKGTAKENTSWEPFWYVVAEACFVILPFVALSFVFIYQSRAKDIFQEPEWSIVSTVMFGQAITKLIYAMIKRTENQFRLNSNSLTAFFSAIILLGLVPSIVTLTLIIALKPIPQWLILDRLPAVRNIFKRIYEGHIWESI